MSSGRPHLCLSWAGNGRRQGQTAVPGGVISTEQKDSSMVSQATFYRRHGKRLLDLALALLALLLLSPLLLLLAVLVRVFLGKPILFRQTRSGRNQRPFTILKFRTMTDARDASGKPRPDSERLTRFGLFLRRTSLDELPELLNVLKGEMSLVGPRPLLPQYDTYYTPREMLRFEYLPGISGWAQISGRNDLPWDDRLECDAWYAESCSLLLDLRIMLLTLVKVLRRENVQADPGLTFGNLDDERRQRHHNQGLAPIVGAAESGAGSRYDVRPAVSKACSGNR